MLTDELIVSLTNYLPRFLNREVELGKQIVNFSFRWIELGFGFTFLYV